MASSKSELASRKMARSMAIRVSVHRKLRAAFAHLCVQTVPALPLYRHKFCDPVGIDNLVRALVWLAP
jgi:hypothetical protein